jgi:hypothetical protein
MNTDKLLAEIENEIVAMASKVDITVRLSRARTITKRLRALAQPAEAVEGERDAFEAPLAVLVGPGHLVASVGELRGVRCVLVKEPVDGRLVLVVLGTNNDHLARIADALNYAPTRDVLVEALQRIERWFDEFPDTGLKWGDGSPMSFGAAFGSNGERDYMRGIAQQALAKYAEGETT